MIDCKHIPAEMKMAQRWVLWRYVVKQKGDKPSKVPYYVTGKERGKNGCLDDEKDFALLATLTDALAAFSAGGGRFAGIGFALGPDGSGNHWQGIDLDHMDEKGLHDLATTLPSYVERSPSGNGVHAIGYGKPFNNLGSNASGIEAYSEKRYFTVTGTVLIGDSICDLSGFVADILVELHGKGRKADQDPCFTQRHRSIGSYDSQDSHDSQDPHEREGTPHRAAKKLGDVSIADLPESCRPTGYGQRHRILFNLARHLKSIYPDAEAKGAIPIVRAWHTEYINEIGTKAWAETWADFARAWQDIKHLEGEGVLDELLARIDKTEPPPPDLEELGYDAAMWAMVRLLKAMAERSADGTFFIGNRTLARLFNTSAPTAGKLLRLMADNQIIELLKRGSMAKGEGGKAMQASTYRYIWRGATDETVQRTLTGGRLRRDLVAATCQMISENA
jgi:hypothetical protein